MSSDYFIKITKIEGESKADGHVNEIDVQSWSWGVSNSTSVAVGTGLGKGKANPSDLSFMHVYDKASPVLASFCAKGTHIDEIKLTGRKSGEGQQDYLIITLTGAFITSVQASGSSGGDVMESVSCAFKKLKIEYKMQDTAGKMTNGPEFTWDVEANKVS